MKVSFVTGFSGIQKNGCSPGRSSHWGGLVPTARSHTIFNPGVVPSFNAGRMGRSVDGRNPAITGMYNPLYLWHKLPISTGEGFQLSTV